MKRNGEAGSLAESARYGEIGVVAVNDPAGYRQAEAGSFGIDEPGFVVAVEPLENGIDLIVGYADACVLDTHNGSAFVEGAGDCDGAARLGVADGVVEQNRKQLADPLPISC